MCQKHNVYALANACSQPANVTQKYAVIDIVKQQVTKVQLPWSGSQSLTGLAPGNYSMQPENVSDSLSNAYQGIANPTTVIVAVNTTAPTTVTYNKIAPGSIAFKVPALPFQLTGYTGLPSVSLTNATTQSIVVQSLPWAATTSVGQLTNNAGYNFSTPTIDYNGYNCSGTFNPASVKSATTPSTVQLSYNCVQIAQDVVKLNVNGLPTTTSSVAVTFTPDITP